MPRGNRMGPEGMGPMTGRRQGFCTGSIGPGFTSAGGFGFNQCFGRGRGLGRGNQHFGFNSNFPQSPQDEETSLKQQASLLEEQLHGIKTRMEELEKSKKK